MSSPPPGLIRLLGLASALSPFGMVVLVPTLGEFARRFGINFAEVQFLISAYLFGLGAAQPFSGMLCDRLGRRPVLLGGFALFVISSLGCAVAGSMSTLVTLRFLQAVGVSVGTVASRAIVRDTHDEAGTARAMGTIAAAMGVAPVLAPVIGGVVSASFGPQAVFYTSALLGAVVWISIRARLQETFQAGSAAAGARQMLRNYPALFRSRVFMGYTLMFGFVQGGFFAFLAVGAPVFEHDLGMDQQAFGLVWGAMAFAYVIAAAGAGRLQARVGFHRVLHLGMGFTLLAGWGLLMLTQLPGAPAWAMIPLLAVLTGASGLVIPGSMAGAVSYRPEIAGTSSGLSSALGLVLSGAFTILAGFFYRGDFAPVAALIAVAATLTAVTGYMVRPAAPAGPAAAQP